MRMIKLANGRWLLTIDDPRLITSGEVLTFEMEFDTAAYVVEELQ